MALDAKHVQLRDTIMEGLRIAVNKVIEDSIKNNTPLAVSDGKGGVQLIYPKKKIA